MAELTREKRLKKELSLFSVFTLATGATLSSGLFLLPGLAAAKAGPAVVIAYLLAVVPFIPGIISKIELATAMPRAGGVYYFLDRSLGPLAGTIGGIGTWAALILKTSFALVGIGAYLHLFVEVPIEIVAVTLAVGFGVLNLFGARKSGAAQAVLVIALLCIIAWFLVAGATQVQPAHFDNLFAAGWDNIFAAAGLVCVSFMGLTKVASVAEEVKNPERNLPLGIFLALFTAVVIYGVGTAVIVGVIPPETLYPTEKDNLTIVADAAEIITGSRIGVIVMTAAALLAFLSVANAGILSASRYPLAMSRDHLVPRIFRHLNRHRAPTVGILLTVFAVLVCVTVLDPLKIAKLASAFQLLLFALNCLAVIVMRESRIDSYDPGYRSPFYPWMQILGIIAPLAFILVMGWLPIVFSFGLVAGGALWFYYYAGKRVARGGAIYHLFARLGQKRFEGLDRELRGILKEKGLRAEDPYDEVVAKAPFLDFGEDTNFEAIVERAAEKLATRLPLSAGQLHDLFMEGTRVGATPVSKGVALPHTRLPGLDTPLMILARVADGVTIDVNADFIPHIADERIFAIIFLISPEEDAAQHLRMLAQVAQHIDDHHFIEDWLAAPDEQQAKATLLRDECYFALTLASDSPSRTLIDRELKHLALPDDCLIAMIRRAGETIFPKGDTKLRENDHLIIVGTPASIASLHAQYDAPSPPPAPPGRRPG